jgi:hypothetical protein
MTSVFVVWFPGWHGRGFDDAAKIYSVHATRESAEGYIRESTECFLEVEEVPFAP